MAKVAPRPGPLPPPISIQAGALRAAPMVRRKTPSQLRGEQLKRTNVVEVVDESPAVFLGSTNNASEMENEPKKMYISNNPRYTGTRLDEVFPAKKPRLRMNSAKEITKENISTEQPNGLKNLSVLSNLAAKRHQLSCSESSFTSGKIPKEDTVHTHQTIEKCSQNIFRSVTELSSRGERSSSSTMVDMDKALKGLVASAAVPSSSLSTSSTEKFGQHMSTYSENFCSECHIPGQKAPLDFTLKTKVRVASSCSVNWIHRSIMCSTYNGKPQLTSRFGCYENSSSSGNMLESQILNSKAFHSWVYPQSTLPSSVISMLTSAASDGGEKDFIQKRHLAWEDSFRSLYYMLRRNICTIFYVCTSHFVVMFINSDDSGRLKCTCNAYISRSTRALRSSLREHDVCFSMPLCLSRVEQVTTEDLVELSEIEKQNLGQTRRRSSMYDVDNSTQSLLAFSGNQNVQGLYDFLLNYRSFLTFMSGVDVPVLYSPVPFQNAALSAPEIRCLEMKRADRNAASAKDGDTLQVSSAGLCSSIEIKDAYIPPWIIASLCALIGSQGRNFEASFTTESTSIGLNMAIGTICENPDSQARAGQGLQENSHALGIPEAILTPSLRSGFLKSLKYSEGSYVASLTPV